MPRDKPLVLGLLIKCSYRSTPSVASWLVIIKQTYLCPYVFMMMFLADD